MDVSNSATSLSLLLRIRDNDRDAGAWLEFVDRYGKKIFGWCVNRRLGPEDSQEVTQEVLLKLSRRLGTFDYDPQQSFRGWLRRVTENALIDFIREDQRRLQFSQGTDVYALLEDVGARQELQSALEESFDLELFEQAVQRVRGRVSDERFQAWSLTAREGRNAADVGTELNMKIATVYSARHYVQSLIADEVQQLEGRTEKAAATQNTE